MERQMLLCKMDKLSERCEACIVPPYSRGHYSRNSWCIRHCYHARKLLVIGRRLDRLVTKMRKKKSGQTHHRQTA